MSNLHSSIAADQKSSGREGQASVIAIFGTWSRTWATSAPTCCSALLRLPRNHVLNVGGDEPRQHRSNCFRPRVPARVRTLAGKVRNTRERSRQTSGSSPCLVQKTVSWIETYLNVFEELFKPWSLLILHSLPNRFILTLQSVQKCNQELFHSRRRSRRRRRHARAWIILKYFRKKIVRSTPKWNPKRTSGHKTHSIHFLK